MLLITKEFLGWKVCSGKFLSVFVQYASCIHLEQQIKDNSVNCSVMHFKSDQVFLHEICHVIFLYVCSVLHW